MHSPNRLLRNLLHLTLVYISLGMIGCLLLSGVTWRWKYTIEQVVGYQVFIGAFIACLVLLAGFHYDRIKAVIRVLSLNSIGILLIVGAPLGITIFRNAQLSVVIVAILLTLSYFFSQKRKNIVKKKDMEISRFSHSEKGWEILKDLFDAEGRTPILYAILCFIAIPLFLIFELETIAEQFGIAAFYLIVIGVVVQLIEERRKISRENKLLARLVRIKDGLGGLVKAATASAKGIVWLSFRHHGMVPFLVKAFIFAVIMALVVLGQSSYWKTITRIVDVNPSYQSVLKLKDFFAQTIVFDQNTTEVILSVKIIHPFSNPRIWQASGADAVKIVELWFEKGDDSTPEDAVYKRTHNLGESLIFNASQDIMIRLTRPNLPGQRTYEVHFRLLQNGIRWFEDTDESVVKLSAYLDVAPGLLGVYQVRETLNAVKLRLAEAQGGKLLASPDHYRSRLSLKGKVDPITFSPLKVEVTNTSKLPWPGMGEHAVNLGVAWVQIINGKKSIVKIGERFFSLGDTLYPGQSRTITFKIDPLLYPAADEIWVGMVHQKRNWFFERGDGIIKLGTMKNMRSVDIGSLIEHTRKLLKEADALERMNFEVINKINDATLSNEKKYRSEIKLLTSMSGKVLKTNSRVVMDLNFSIENRSEVAWPTGVDKRVTIAFLWFKKGGNPTSHTQAVFNQKLFLESTLMEGTLTHMNCKILPKVPPGEYELWVTLVHEGNSWFYERGDKVLKLSVVVK